MAIPKTIEGREYTKFVESPTRDKETAIEVFVGGVDTNANQETITLVDTSSSSYIYIGSALPSSLSSESKWRIQRVDLTTSEIKILYANESQEFTNVWDNRVGLIYG
jgi:hypothetical protein